MTNKTENIPIPYTQIVLSRAQENWKERKVQILSGAGLSILGLALIPIIGPFSAIICSVGLAVLGHGLFRDPKHSPSLLPKNTTPIQRIDTTPKRVAEKMFEAFCKKPFDPLTATQEEKEIHNIFQAIAKNDAESLTSKLRAFKDCYPEKYPAVWAAARELSKLLKRQETTLSQFDPALKQPEKSSKAALVIGSVLGGVFLYGLNHLLRKANDPNVPQDRDPSSPPSSSTREKEEKPTEPPSNNGVPLKPKEPTCPWLQNPLIGELDLPSEIPEEKRKPAFPVSNGDMHLKPKAPSCGSWLHSPFFDTLTSQVPQENGKIVSGIGGSIPIHPVRGAGFWSIGPRTYGFTLSDLRSLLGILHEKKIPSSLAPFIRALRSLLNDDSLSSNPLILVSLDQRQIDHLQSFLGKESLFISDGVSSLAVHEVNPAKNEMPITEVIFFCKLQECQELLLLLQDSDDFHLLSGGGSGSETGLTINSLNDPNQMSFIRITKEKFIELLEEKPDLLSFLLNGNVAPSLPESSPTTNLNGEEFLQIADVFERKNMKTKAKNEELGARLLAIGNEDKPQNPTETGRVATGIIVPNSANPFSTTNTTTSGLSTLLAEDPLPKKPSREDESLNGEKFLQIADRLKSENENTKAKNNELGARLLAIGGEKKPQIPQATHIVASEKIAPTLTNPSDAFLSDGHQTFGLTLSDLETLFALLQGKKIPTSLAPFIHALRSELNDSLQSSSSNPLILISFDRSQNDALQSLLEKGPHSLLQSGEDTERVSSLTVSGVNREQNEKPITEVVILCNPKDCEALLLLLEEGDNPHLLSRESDTERGLVLNSLTDDPNQLSIIRITRERFMQLLQKHPDLLSFLQGGNASTPRPKSPPSMSMNGEGFLHIADVFAIKNEKTKAKNKDLGDRLLAIGSEMPQQFSTTNTRESDLSTILPENSVEENLDWEYFEQIADSLKSWNEKTKAKNEELGSRLFAISSEMPQQGSTPNHLTSELSTPLQKDIASPHLEPKEKSADQPPITGTKTQVDFADENHHPLLGEVFQAPSRQFKARTLGKEISFLKRLFQEEAPSEINPLFTSPSDVPTIDPPPPSSKETQFLGLLNPVLFKLPICELNETVFLDALSNKSDTLLSPVVSSSADLSFRLTQIPITMVAAIITTLVVAPLIFPTLSHYFSPTPTPLAILNIAHPMALPVEGDLPLAVEERSVKCNGVSKVVLATVTSLGIISYFYLSKNETSNENKIPENNEDDIYSIYIDQKSNSQWENKALNLHSPDGTESQQIAVVQPHQAKDPSSVTAASFLPEMNTLASQVIKCLLDVAATAVQMGITHLQNKPGELRRERMIYQTLKGPVDLITERVLKETKKSIEQTGMFLWEAGQPIVNNIVIPFATHSYAFSKAFTLILFDWLKTAIVLFAEQAKEFINWASTPSPNPQHILEKAITPTSFLVNEIEITADANKINLNNDNPIDSKANLLWNKGNKENEIFFQDENYPPSNNTSAGLVQNNLKSLELNKETFENSSPKQASIIPTQSASEEENSKKKPTLSKADSSSCFGVHSQAIISEKIVDAEETPSDKKNDGDPEIDYIKLANKYSQTNIELKEKNKTPTDEANLEVALDTEITSTISPDKNEIHENSALDIEQEQNNNEHIERNNIDEGELDFAGSDTETTSAMLSTEDDNEIYEDSESDYFINLANKFEQTNSELKQRNDEAMNEGLLEKV